MCSAATTASAAAPAPSACPQSLGRIRHVSSSVGNSSAAVTDVSPTSPFSPIAITHSPSVIPCVFPSSSTTRYRFHPPQPKAACFIAFPTSKSSLSSLNFSDCARSLPARSVARLTSARPSMTPPIRSVR